ncbi:MAG: prepilin-type N-terminal cleavage/methylation domain-containing protein [bacterium]|nr:prepilin-type N-terminal cleavage/methylation domain-containing protein [bacterium]
MIAANPARSGLTLLEVVLATALLSIAAVSLLNWLDASRPSSDAPEVELVVGISSLDRAADAIVTNPSRFGVLRATDGGYRWDTADSVEDQRRQIEGRFEVQLVRATAEFDRLRISQGDRFVTRWYIRPPKREGR